MTYYELCSKTRLSGVHPDKLWVLPSKLALTNLASGSFQTTHSERGPQLGNALRSSFLSGRSDAVAYV